ncbi:flavin monoamine oxidase family protein [Pseudonocardia nigra]|uniref:flavin monoamine oxidase family protein n=1 Tax=Pseudonocardia nigra TaxID=1921578 RepID=UPI0027E25088|nr:FAD-dependent oxidoreductase [Pseudonocardia nigra]
MPTFPTHITGTHLLRLGGRTRRWHGALPPLGAAASVAFAGAGWRLDRMARAVSPEAPWLAPRAAVWDGETLAGWARRNVSSARARALLATVVRAVWSVEPGDVSLLHVLACIRAAGGLQRLTGTRGGAQQDRFVGGSHRIAELLAERLPEPPLLGRPVRRIAQDDDHVTVHADGVVVEAHRVIVALPPMLASRIDYQPAMPAGRAQLLARTPQGTTLKCLAVYDTPFWRRAGLSGHVVSDEGPDSATFDNSPPEGSPGVLLGFVVGAHATRLLMRTPEERRRAVLPAFGSWFGDAATTPRTFLVGSWSEDEWTRGCYAGYFVPGAWTSFGQWLRTPHGRIHWAGTETANRWIGFMGGAVTAGERAADEVHRALASDAAPVGTAR